jgi:putative ABC transport system permease protein
MFKFAYRNLLSRPMRSLLSLLGLTVAILGLVGLFSVARGLDRLVSSTFDRVHGLVAMQPGAPIPLFSRLPTKWGDEIAAVAGVGAVCPEVWTRVNVIDEKMIISPPRFLFGTDIPARLTIRQGIYRDDIVEGRFLVPEDRGTLHAVVSRQIAEEFHKTLGDTLRVNGYDVEIVGIYHCGSLLLDVAIILDIDQVRNMSRFDADSVSSFYIEQTGEVPDDVLEDRIRDVFQGRPVETSSEWGKTVQSAESLGKNPVSMGLRALARWIDAGSAQPSREEPKAATAPASTSPRSGSASAGPSKVAPGDLLHVDESSPIEIRSAEAWAERFDRFADDLDIFLTVLTGIGVTIAVLSIVNTMLMSVTERMIEFGILKANGWSRSDVLFLITCESGLLGVSGGVLGSAAGWGATHVINALWPTRVTLYASPGLLAFSVAFSTALGVLGGLYPALWAMRMMPMDAIRRG